MAESGQARKLVGAVESHYEAFLGHLGQLTSIDCPSGYKPGLDRVAEVVHALLDEIGADVRVIENPETGNDLVGVIQGSGSTRVLMLCHTDTVYPVGTAEARPFRVEGKRALGPGVADMKGGLLAAIYAVRALRETELDRFGSITILCNSDEESAPRHSVAMIRELARGSDAAFCLEAGRANGNIVSARKGSIVFRVKAHGREAHAGVNPEQGRNAIVALCERIPEIWNLNGSYPGVTVSPGLISGGTAVNTVPALCTCDIDIRVTQSAQIEALEVDVRRLLEASVVADVSFELENRGGMPPMERTEGTDRLVRCAKQAAMEIGFEVDDTATGGGSDGAHAAAVGTAVLDGLGPVGGNAHSEREYLELDSIVPRTALLARLVTLLSE